MDRRHFLRLAGMAGIAPFTIRMARAAAFPDNPVRLVVPYTPGGANDVIARLVANGLSDLWGQQVVIENKGGAGGNIGIEFVARSEADGYTLLLAPIAMAVNRFLYRSLRYDPVSDFAPVTMVCTQPNIMVVPNSSPARTVREFISYANANRGHVSFASGGVGTSLHLCGELFKRMAGIEMTHVPYRGSGPALNDLVSGRVDVMFNSMGSILPQVQAGAVRGLAVTTREKVAAVPSLPTVAQSGVPGFDVSSWFAIYAPAKTPSARVGKIQRDIATVLTYPAIKGKLEALGSVVVGSAPAALMAHLKAEMDKWGPIIRDAHITTG